MPFGITNKLSIRYVGFILREFTCGMFIVHVRPSSTPSQQNLERILEC